jgi:hypothetical protein
MPTSQPNILIIPFIATLFFCISKFAEMKYIDKDIKPIKVLFRDALIVFIASLSATYIFFYFSDSIQEFMNIVTDSKTGPSSIGGSSKGISSSAEIFTDNPNF